MGDGLEGASGSEMNRGPTLFLLTGLCARLRLACEAIGREGDHVLPADVRLEDLSAEEQARLEQLGQQDLWALINQIDPVRPSTTSTKRVRAGVA